MAPVIGSRSFRIALGEQQSAAVMQLGSHTCFQTALAPHRDPAMPACQDAQPFPWFARIGGKARRPGAGAIRRLPAGEQRGSDQRILDTCLTLRRGALMAAFPVPAWGSAVRGAGVAHWWGSRVSAWPSECGAAVL